MLPRTAGQVRPKSVVPRSPVSQDVGYRRTATASPDADVSPIKTGKEEAANSREEALSYEPTHRGSHSSAPTVDRESSSADGRFDIGGFDASEDERVEPIDEDVPIENIDPPRSAVGEEPWAPQQSSDAPETVDSSHRSPSAQTRHMAHSSARPTEGEDQPQDETDMAGIQPEHTRFVSTSRRRQLQDEP